jgi:hypothetical protein
MIKDFKSFVFVSVDVKGVAESKFVSVDVKRLRRKSRKRAVEGGGAMAFGEGMGKFLGRDDPGARGKCGASWAAKLLSKDQIMYNTVRLLSQE